MTHPCSIKGCDEPVRTTVGEVDLCERHEHMLYDWWRERLQQLQDYYESASQ